MGGLEGGKWRGREEIRNCCELGLSVQLVGWNALLGLLCDSEQSQESCSLAP